MAGVGAALGRGGAFEAGERGGGLLQADEAGAEVVGDAGLVGVWTGERGEDRQGLAVAWDGLLGLAAEDGDVGEVDDRPGGARVPGAEAVAEDLEGAALRGLGGVEVVDGEQRVAEVVAEVADLGVVAAEARLGDREGAAVLLGGAEVVAEHVEADAVVADRLELAGIVGGERAVGEGGGEGVAGGGEVALDDRHGGLAGAGVGGERGVGAVAGDRGACVLEGAAGVGGAGQLLGHERGHAGPCAGVAGVVAGGGRGPHGAVQGLLGGRGLADLRQGLGEGGLAVGDLRVPGAGLGDREGVAEDRPRVAVAGGADQGGGLGDAVADVADDGVVAVGRVVAAACDAGARVLQAVGDGDGALDEVGVGAGEQVDGLAQVSAVVVEAAHATRQLGLALVAVDAGRRAHPGVRVDPGGRVGVEGGGGGVPGGGGVARAGGEAGRDRGAALRVPHAGELGGGAVAQGAGAGGLRSARPATRARARMLTLARARRPGRERRPRSQAAMSACMSGQRAAGVAHEAALQDASQPAGSLRGSPSWRASGSPRAAVVGWASPGRVPSSASWRATQRLYWSLRASAGRPWRCSGAM